MSSLPVIGTGTSICPVCSSTFPKTHHRRKYCSTPCSRTAHYTGYKKEQMTKQLENARARVLRGYCWRCKSRQHPAFGQYCEYHWYQSTASRHLGTKGHRKSAHSPRFVGESIKTLLVSQGSECPYTGIRLLPGKNCQLDHVLPKVRYPHLANSLENLEWVHGLINRMKTHLTKDEFIVICRLVAARTKAEDIKISAEDILLDESRWRNYLGGKKANV